MQSTTEEQVAQPLVCVVAPPAPTPTPVQTPAPPIAAHYACNVAKLSPPWQDTKAGTPAAPVVAPSVQKEEPVAGHPAGGDTSAGDIVLPVVHRYTCGALPATEGSGDGAVTLRQMMGFFGPPEPPTPAHVGHAGSAAAASRRSPSAGPHNAGPQEGPSSRGGSPPRPGGAPMERAVGGHTGSQQRMPSPSSPMPSETAEEVTTTSYVLASPLYANGRADSLPCTPVQTAGMQDLQQSAPAEQNTGVPRPMGVEGGCSMWVSDPEAHPPQSPEKPSRGLREYRNADSQSQLQAKNYEIWRPNDHNEQASLADTSTMSADQIKPLGPRNRGLSPSSNPGSGEAKNVSRQASGNLRKTPNAEKPGPKHTAKTPDEELAVSAAAAAVTLRDLAELRSFRKPPAVVCQVLEAVAVLLGVSDSRWAHMRKLLDNNLTGRICSFHPTEVSYAQWERLQVLLQVPTFSDQSLADRCPAVVALANWCCAVGRYLQASPPPPMQGGSPAPVSPSQLAATATPARCRAAAHDPHCACREGRRGQVCRPDLQGLVVEPDLWSLTQAELSRVRELQVTRPEIGSVTFHGETDCRDIAKNLPEIVILNLGEVVVYPDPSTKPPVGSCLNKPASIVLYQCLPKSDGFHDKKSRDKYKRRVKQMTEEKGAEFIDYDCDKGIWQFRVAHF